MMNVIIINAHEAYPFSEGKLNATLVEQAKANLIQKGYEVRVTTMKDDYDIEHELSHHQWADVLILQSPVNWQNGSLVWQLDQHQVYALAHIECSEGCFQ